MNIHNQKGIALLIVLWVILLLSVIASSFSFNLRTEVNLVGNFRSMAQANALAEAGVNRALLEISKPVESRKWAPNGDINEWSLQGAKIKIIIQDVAGLIDLNSGREELIKQLLLNLELPDNLGDHLSDAILDWRDADKLSRINGAEDSDYAAEDHPYGAKDGPFDTVTELLSVLGFTREIYQKISGSVTVYSQQSGINPDVAPREVLLAVPGLEPEQVDEFVTRRSEIRELGEGAPPHLQINGNYMASVNEVAFRILVNVTMPNGTVAFLDTVATRSEDPEKPFVMLAWRNGEAMPEESNDDEEGDGDKSAIDESVE